MSEYKVKVTFTVETVGSTQSEYPDNKVTIEFDATDANKSVMHDKYRDLLSVMGYLPHGRVVVDEVED